MSKKRWSRLQHYCSWLRAAVPKNLGKARILSEGKKLMGASREYELNHLLGIIFRYAVLTPSKTRGTLICEKMKDGFVAAVGGQLMIGNGGMDPFTPPEM